MRATFVTAARYGAYMTKLNSHGQPVAVIDPAVLAIARTLLGKRRVIRWLRRIDTDERTVTRRII